MGAIGTILVTEVVEKEGDQYVSICPELGTASCGDSIEEALANLREAVELYLNAIEDVGERERVFRERGIEVTDEIADETPPRPLPVGKVVRAARHSVPALA